MKQAFVALIIISVLVLSASLPFSRAGSRRNFSLNLTKQIATMTIIGTICFWSGIAGKQFETASDIPDNYFKEKRSIHAMVERIADGDTVRVRHLPSSRSRAYDGPMKDHTIIVRIAAVDTPETAKKGAKGQPYAEEAKAFTENKLLGKEVDVKLLSRDQYGRVIGRVGYSDSYLFGIMKTKRDISEELLKAGLAVVYRQGGAQYDGGVAQWNALEQSAIKQRKGMWKHGKSKVELPSEYKKQQKAQPAVAGGKNNYL